MEEVEIAEREIGRIIEHNVSVDIINAILLVDSDRNDYVQNVIPLLLL